MAEKHHEHKLEHHEKHEHHKKKKWPVVLGVILGVIIIVAAALYFFVFNISTPVGTLHILSGSVQVNNGIVYASATDGMNLKQGYSIKTADNSNTRVVLLDSVILTLDSNTEIKLDTIGKNTVVSLLQGDVWSKFMPGDIQQYTVSALGTSAVAHGTSFNSKISGSDVVLIVSDGNVDFSNSNDKVLVQKSKKYIMSNGRITESSLTPEEKTSIVSAVNNDLTAIKDLRVEMMQRNKVAYDKLKTMFNKNDDDVKAILDQIDKGELNDTQMIAQSPIKLPILGKLANVNTEIKNQQAIILDMQSTQ